MKSNQQRFNMADDKKIETGEEKREKTFSEKMSDTHETHEMLKELLEDTTAKVIEKLGYDRNEKVAGVYGDGTTYGAGVEEDQYNIIVTGRPRKFNSSKNMDHNNCSGTLEKQIFIGAKRVESHVDYEVKGKVLHLQYRSPESGFFRGVNDEGKTFMVREKLSVPLKDAKKQVKDLFTDAAEREVGFLTNTKLGVEDRLDVSTTSIVENLDMKNLTLRSLFEDELDFSKGNINENEEFDQLPGEVEPNIEKVIKLNTQKVDDVKGDKYLLFDDEEESEEDLLEMLKGHMSNPEVSDVFRAELEKEFGVRDFNQLTPAEMNDKERIKKVFNSIDREIVTDDELSEITTAGPAGAGAGRYDTKSFATAERGKKSKGGKKADAGKPYDIPVNDPIYQEEETLSEGAKRRNAKFKNTPYAKSKKKRPSIDKDYNVVPQQTTNVEAYNMQEDKDTNSSKPYVQVVKVDPNYHPLGMPFVKPNSKEEWERTSGVGRDHDKMKRMGLEENDKDRHERLRKRKFTSTIQEEGVNKKYIVTEKTTSEYEKDRWSKLALFNKFETIKEAEELNSVFENLEDKDDFYASKNKQVVKESVEPQVIKEDKENTIEVEKPGSMFGITQKFYEKDFLNENKKFILDLNSMVFVENPNAKK